MDRKNMLSRLTENYQQTVLKNNRSLLLAQPSSPRDPKAVFTLCIISWGTMCTEACCSPVSWKLLRLLNF